MEFWGLFIVFALATCTFYCMTFKTQLTELNDAVNRQTQVLKTHFETPEDQLAEDIARQITFSSLAEDIAREIWLSKIAESIAKEITFSDLDEKIAKHIEMSDLDGKIGRAVGLEVRRILADRGD